MPLGTLALPGSADWAVDYVIRERIQLSKQLMGNPYNNSSEACFKAGFNNLNYISRAFKKVEGVTPSLYKL